MIHTYREAVPALIANGFHVLPIAVGYKYPEGVGAWQSKTFGVDHLAEFGDYGVGILCGKGDNPICAIDIDVSHPGINKAFREWCLANLGDTCERVGAAPRSLFAYRAAESGWGKITTPFFIDETDPVKPSGKPNKQSIEVLNFGQQFVAYHRHPDFKDPPRFYEWVDLMGGLTEVQAAELPIITAEQVEAALQAFESIAQEAGFKLQKTNGKKSVTRAPTESDEMDWADEMPVDGIDETNALEYTVYLHIDDRDEWILLGQALHHQFRGERIGLDLWDECSRRSDKYPGIEDLEYRYDGFGRNTRKPVTFRTIIKMHKERAASQKYQAVAEWKTSITEAPDEFTLREKVCVQIGKDDRLGKLEREQIAQVLKERLASVGAKYPIATCRELVEPRKVDAKGAQRRPAWLTGWVYVTQQDKFYRLDSDEWLTMQGFNARFNRELPPTDGEDNRSAVWEALNVFTIPVVTRAMYIPWAEPLFEMEGVQCANLYKPSSVPAAVDELDRAGQKAVDLVLRHIRFIAGGREPVVDTFLSWIAHNVQQPGVKIRFAPLIKGIEGDGKSLLGALMAGVMGRSNVKDISPKVLSTDFNGWAEGSAVGVLEEIKLTGHNRHDILNALKPLIANDTMAVHRKGVDEYNSINTTNYIAFTNHQDALPLRDDDRRWWVLFTPVNGKADLAAALGDDPRTYFDRLHSAINNHRGALRRFFLDHPIPTSFNRNGTAPDTDEKRAMVASGVAHEEQVALSVIERGAYGVTKGVLSSADLMAAVLNCDEHVSLQSNEVNRLLIRMGYVQMPKPIKWDQKTRRVWTRGVQQITNKEVRAILDATKGAENNDFDDVGVDGSFSDLI